VAVCEAVNSALAPRLTGPALTPSEAVTLTPALNELLVDTIVPVALWLPYRTCEPLLPPFMPGGAYTMVSIWYAGNTWPEALAFTATEARPPASLEVAVTPMVAVTGVIFCAAVRIRENAVAEGGSDGGEKVAVIPGGSPLTARLAAPGATILSTVNSTATCCPLLIETLDSAGKRKRCGGGMGMIGLGGIPGPGIVGSGIVFPLPVWIEPSARCSAPL
jgi:hypothetical protein